MRHKMNKDFIMRNGIWVLLISFALYLLKPALAEQNTIFFIVAMEAIALALSSIALFAYSKINFTENQYNSNMGLIFLGVHLSVGLGVVGIYIMQI
jgi:hypothetical protein